jgi:hypothetical protein
MLNLMLLTLVALDGDPTIDVSGHNAAQLKKDCEKLLASLKPQTVARERRRVVEVLKGQDPKAKVEALCVLAKTGDPNALPLMVPHLESQDELVRIWAGATVSELVERYTLRRRDPKIGERIVLMPRGKEDLDLRPLAWLVVQMLRKPDDGNTHSYAAVLIRYLELREFTLQLRQLLQSRHPAVSNKAKWALDELAGQQDPTKRR